MLQSILFLVLREVSVLLSFLSLVVTVSIAISFFSRDRQHCHSDDQREEESGTVEI